MVKKIFISTPISAFETDDEYKRFRLWLEHLELRIMEHGEDIEVFCVALLVGSIGSLDDPKDSLLHDLEKINWCSDFLLIYPKESPTSALIELGIALAKGKRIVISHPKVTEMPFMASQMHRIIPSVEDLTFDAFDSVAIDSIVDKIISRPSNDER